MIENLVQRAGLYANLAGATAIVSGLALFIFFAGLRIFGLINDVTGILLLLFLVPVVLAIHRSLAGQAPGISLAAAAVCIIAILIYAALQAALVIGLVRFEQSLPYVMLTSGVVGLWLLVSSFLALRLELFPAGLAWVGIIAGLGLPLSLVGFWIGGQEHPLAAIGFLVSFFALPIWLFWLARLINSGTLPVS